jgi:iron complex outermembrane receptor protein
VHAEPSVEDSPFDLSLQELLDIEVTSVSRQSEPLSNAAAAIHVILGDEIVRHGYRSIPEALKNVPGLHVAQIDSQKWAVSSRGFNGRYNNKMLVLLDGRTLYSPEFSGVYWDTQDTLMADIERIEVIRGPGAAMWGANAVNGVINIITKHSAETQSGYAFIGAGEREQGFAGFRYGGRLAEGVTARAYAKGFKRDDLDFDPNDVSPGSAQLIEAEGSDNDWWSQQLGGRVDLSIDQASTLTLSAAAYESHMHQTVNLPTLTSPYMAYTNSHSKSRGWHILADYTRALSANSQINIKSYFDHAKRDEPDLLGFSRDTFDIELNHQLDLGSRHDVLWGVGFRHINNELNPNTEIVSSDSYDEQINLWSLFAQDTITLKPDTWWLTLAARLEHHSYVDMEWQPTIRLSWQPADRHRFWTALSRAVRTPSHVERNYDLNVGTLPPMTAFNPSPFPNRLVFAGNDDFDSETVDSIELGYRYANSAAFSLDTALFYNHYDDLRSISGLAVDTSSLPAFIETQTLLVNNTSGYNYGLELAANWLLSKELKLGLSYTYIESRFDDGQAQNTDAPEQIVSLNMNWAVSHNVDFVGTWRYVDGSQSIDQVQGLNNQLDAYQSVDLGINWHLNPSVTVSAFGRNLFYGSHVEYLAESFAIPYRVEPSFFGQVQIRF